jgi:hypothetical protein
MAVTQEPTRRKDAPAFMARTLAGLAHEDQWQAIASSWKIPAHDKLTPAPIKVGLWKLTIAGDRRTAFAAEPVTKVKKGLICDSRRLRPRRQRTPAMRLSIWIPSGTATVSGAILMAAMMLSPAGDALASGRYHDYIYSDSFGNLIIQSPSGFKRIVVGQGHLAKQLSSYEAAEDEYADDDIVTIDENGYRSYRDCRRPPYLFKGRSYMYGLPDGVIPQAPCQ